MNQKINDGGRAFPALDDAGSGLHLREPGMTLRDYFAAKALSAFLSQADGGVQEYAPSTVFSGGKTAAQYWAEGAYEIADAMIAARAASPSGQ